tara:strand:+ start:156 stop:428 length:273 start_codon:yes stop_codon:yes gene_type:complete
MEAIILFKTDFNHTFSSRDLIGVFTNKRKFKQTVKQIIKKDCDPETLEAETPNEWVKYHYDFMITENHDQTQGLNSFELVSETIELNELF